MKVKTHHKINIKPNGELEFVHDDELTTIVEALGATATKTRASHVEPTSPTLKALFRRLRFEHDDDSNVAAWTRTWTCEWEANIINGPTLGPFSDRDEAIAAEIAWLEANRIN